MKCKFLLKIIDFIDEDEFLPLAVCEDRFRCTRNRVEHSRKIADVEPKNSPNVVFAHHVVNIPQALQRDLRDTKAFEVHDEAIILNAARE